MKGNKKAQRKRRKKRMRIQTRAPDEYLLIDGNWSYYPYAYCTRKGAYLTLGLAELHKCEKRNCERFERVMIK